VKRRNSYTHSEGAKHLTDTDVDELREALPSDLLPQMLFDVIHHAVHLPGGKPARRWRLQTSLGVAACRAVRAKDGGCAHEVTAGGIPVRIERGDRAIDQK
jgi:hypothetical protein